MQNYREQKTQALTFTCPCLGLYGLLCVLQSVDNDVFKALLGPLE